MSDVLTKLPVTVSGSTIEVVIVRLADGRVVARTVDELRDATDEVRVAAGFPPKS
jgi:hypothetical protein